MKTKGDTVEILGKKYKLISEPSQNDLMWILFLQLKGHHAYELFKEWDIEIACLKDFNRDINKYFTTIDD